MSDKHLEIFRECFEDMTEEEQANTKQFINAYVNQFRKKLKPINERQKVQGFVPVSGMGDESVKELITVLLMEGLL